MKFTPLPFVLYVLGILLPTNAGFLETPVVKLNNTVASYTGIASSTSGRVHYFEVANLTLSTSIRLTLNSDDATLKYPLNVNVIEPKVLLSSFAVPFAFRKSRTKQDANFTQVERTLCLIMDDEEIQNSTQITLVVSTGSVSNVSYYLEMTRTEDFLLSINSSTETSVAKNAPRYFGYRFNTGEDFVKVSVTQKNISNFCITASIQTLSCPIFDLEENVHFEGHWQTIQSAGLLTVERSGQYTDGFVLVIVANNDNQSCIRKDPFGLPVPTSKADVMDFEPNIEITIEGYRYHSTFHILVNILTPLVVTLGVAYGAWRLLKKRNEWVLKSFAGNNEVDSNVTTQTENDYLLRHGESPENRKWTLGTAPKKLTDFEVHAGVECDNRHYTLSYIVAPYYVVPVCQFAIYYYRTSRITGDSDICYYNFRCATTFGPLVDFNHFWSNSSYIILGVIYLVIVHQRQKFISKHKENTNTGINIPFGMFQALGVALIVEGVLSAAYHLCPNQSTFQFDTCFMYIIAVLLMFTMHHLRHPTFLAADGTFIILVALLLIPVVGYLTEAILKGFSFIWIFIVIKYVTWMLVSFNYAVVGFVKEEEMNTQTTRLVTGLKIFSTCKNIHALKEVPTKRFILPALSFILSTSVLIYSSICQVGFPSYLLYLLISNVLLIIGYYFIMKKVHGEFRSSTHKIPTSYFLAGFLIGGVACYYFLNTASGWELSPSASRAMNKNCYNWPFRIFPGFYDSHDLWHFLSALALFLAFMGLLVLDDDLLTMPKDRIHVF